MTLENAFKRAQYGVTIKITPTCIRAMKIATGSRFDHARSDITFDTIRSDVDNQPNVIRRNIKNENHVMDGETIISGGLRRKDTNDALEVIPFIGSTRYRQAVQQFAAS